jgi:hypothetical protein
MTISVIADVESAKASIAEWIRYSKKDWTRGHALQAFVPKTVSALVSDGPS